MKQKDIRFDKLKLFAMLGIVFIHCVANCEVLANVKYLSFQYFFISIIYTFCFAMTNVFVIVSSYLLINKYKKHAGQIRINKVFGMIALASFYATTIYIILVVCGAVDFKLFDFLRSVFSVFVNQYWFVGSYLFLYIISPLLFKALNVFGERELRSLCLVSIVFFSILPTGFIFESTLEFYDAQHGKSIVWLVILFCLTFYLDKFGVDFIKKIKKISIILTVFGSVLVLVTSRVLLRYMSFHLGMAGDGEGRLFFDESVFILLISFGVFILTLKTPQKNTEETKDKVISAFSGTTFGIYLIHNNPYLRNVMWLEAERVLYTQPGAEFISVIVVVLVVFVFCSLCELGRIFVVKHLPKIKCTRGIYDRTPKD